MDKISVMICDDSALMRNLIGRIITEIDGFEIAGKAENGQVCLSMIEEKKPDVILLDVEMPVMNGIEFLKKRFNNPKDMYKTIFEYIWNLPSLMTIFQLQDLIKLDNRGRINWPGTVGEPNWCFKFKDFSWKKKVQFFNK